MQGPLRALGYSKGKSKQSMEMPLWPRVLPHLTAEGSLPDHILGRSLFPLPEFHKLKTQLCYKLLAWMYLSSSLLTRTKRMAFSAPNNADPHNRTPFVSETKLLLYTPFPTLYSKQCTLSPVLLTGSRRVSSEQMLGSKHHFSLLFHFVLSFLAIIAALPTKGKIFYLYLKSPAWKMSGIYLPHLPEWGFYRITTIAFSLYSKGCLLEGWMAHKE